MKKLNAYKEISNDKKLRIAFGILFLLVLFLLMYIYRFFFWPFVFGIIFYIALAPLHRFLLKYIRNKSLTSVLLLFAFIMVVIIPTTFIVFLLANQTFDFYNFMSKQFDPYQLQTFLLKSKALRKLYVMMHLSNSEVLAKFAQIMQTVSMTVLSSLTQFVSSSIRLVINFFFMILIMAYLFAEGPAFFAIFQSLIPFPKTLEKKVTSRLNEVIKVLLAGNLLIMILQGTLVGFGFFIFDLGSPLLWGIMAAIFSLIPVIGTSLVWLPASIYLFATGKIWPGIGLIAWCLVWYNVFENILKPVLFGKKMDFHPLVLFFLLIGSINAFGLPGILLGPILLTLFISLWEIYKIITVKEEPNNQ